MWDPLKKKIKKTNFKPVCFPHHMACQFSHNTIIGQLGPTNPSSKKIKIKLRGKNVVVVTHFDLNSHEEIISVRYN